MSDAVVLVTGCSTGGIGSHLCEQFAERGCIVYATSRRLETMEGLEHDNIHKRAMDVTKDDDVQSIVGEVLQTEGRIDVVVNNAGAIAICPVAEATTEQVRDTFELNTFGALRVVNAASPSMMKRQQGLIVNIGSVSADITTPWNTLYCASKAALHRLTEGLAMELKPFGVNVMLVAPGAVKSNLSKNQAATFELPSTSVYDDHRQAMISRMEYSSNLGGMATDEFARQIVSRALSAHPPPYISIGGKATTAALLQWLPRQFVLDFVAKKFMWKNKA